MNEQTNHLECVIEDLSNLPKDLYEQFTQIRKLDVQTLKNLKKAAKDASMDSKNELYKEAIRLSEEKLKLATMAYENVDQCIHKIDAQIADLTKKIAKERENFNEIAKKMRCTEIRPEPQIIEKKKNKEIAAAPQPFLLEDLPVDPNEPLYCFCRRVSFGKMIACENENCKYEWFHFPCVGITKEPKGKWYCPECKKALKKKNYRHVRGE